MPERPSRPEGSEQPIQGSPEHFEALLQRYRETTDAMSQKYKGYEENSKRRHEWRMKMVEGMTDIEQAFTQEYQAHMERLQSDRDDEAEKLRNGFIQEWTAAEAEGGTHPWEGGTPL